MPRYTDAQKAAYYKKKFLQESKKKSKRPSTRGRKQNSNYQYPGFGRSLGSMAGNYIAPGIGGFVGGAIGDVAQAGIKSITGFGDYTVKSNSLLYNKDAVPKFSHTNPRCTIICHREFIKDIRSSINFDSTTFDLNPGNPKMFPWLSTIAANYEEYIFQGIIFEFKTNSATAVSSTNTALGSVCMASQYNSLAPEFTSKHQIENYEFSNASVPCESFLHAIECDPATGNEVRYIFNERDSDLNADPRLYNLCKTTIATQGMQAASTIGELWVSYKVCLMKPKLGYQQSLMDCYKQDAPLTVTIADPLGNVPLNPSLKNSGFVIQDVTAPNLNIFDVDSSFNGILRCEVNYKLNSFAAFQSPYWFFPATSSNVITDVTELYTGKLSTDVTSLDPLGPGSSCSVVAYFQFLGGYDTTGNDPQITLISMSGGSINMGVCQCSFTSVPDQSVLPEFA